MTQGWIKKLFQDPHDDSNINAHFSFSRSSLTFKQITEPILAHHTKKKDFSLLEEKQNKKHNMCGWFPLSHLFILCKLSWFRTALPGLRRWVSRVGSGRCRWCHTSPVPTPSRGASDRTSGRSRIVWRCPWWSTARPCASLSIASALGVRSGRVARPPSTGWCSDARPAGSADHSPRSTDNCSAWTLSRSSDCQRCPSTLITDFRSTPYILHLIAYPIGDVRLLFTFLDDHQTLFLIFFFWFFLLPHSPTTQRKKVFKIGNNNKSYWKWTEEKNLNSAEI